jgi:hypothetical protein
MPLRKAFVSTSIRKIVMIVFIEITKQGAYILLFRIHLGITHRKMAKTNRAGNEELGVGPYEEIYAKFKILF